MEEFLISFLIVTGVNVLGLISPGPDFVMISRMSIAYGRRVGVFAALGVTLGVVIHVGYSLLGLSYLMTQSVLLFNVVKYLGAAYLVYIGIKALRAKKQNLEEGIEPAQVKNNAPTLGKSVVIGFMTNVLNPKATLFFFSIFTQVVEPGTSLAVQGIYGLMMLTTTFTWFSLVATILSHRTIRKRIRSVQHYVDRGMGAILVALGVRIAIPDNK